MKQNMKLTCSILLDFIHDYERKNNLRFTEEQTIFELKKYIYEFGKILD